MGAAMLVRTLETLGQAVVDMRGTDAADPRLVLEIALVRLARRDAGPPVQALAERVERLERAARSAPLEAASAETAAEPAARPARSFGELRRERADAPPSAPEPVSASRDAPAPDVDDTSAEPVAASPVDIDDVVVAWAEILPELPPATRAAVREAQPLEVDGDVITFGVPRAHYDVALPRFRKEADNIRGALSAKLGRRMKFKPVAHDGFDAPASAPPITLDDPPPDDDDEVLDLDELVDARPDAAAVDSLSLLARSFDATVVEEVPRD
jgi:DNA polymerase-3 subunit gamma/tau